MIRTLQWNADSGFNRMYWGMEEKGIRFPGSPKPAPGAPEPGGFQVLAGTYKVVLSYAGASDSTMVTVKDDPRLGNRNDVKIAQRKMVDRLQKSAEKLTDLMDRLTEADEVCNKITAQLKDLTGKEIDSLRKTASAMQKEIKDIREIISGKRDERQGITRNPAVTVMNQLQMARQYIMAKSVAPGEQEEKLVQNAEGSINTVVQNTNDFFENKWKKFKALVESTKIELFKEYKPL
jgi:NACalpha-BTF3-like transcription factor